MIDYTPTKFQLLATFLRSEDTGKRIQSHHNYDSFLSKSHLHGTILLTKPSQNCSKGFIKTVLELEQFAISRRSISDRKRHCDMR